MKKALGVLALVVLSTGALNATVACSTLVGQTVLNANPSSGCTIGPLTFSNFAVLGFGSPGTAEVDFGANSQSGGVINLNFNPNLGSGTTGGSITDLHFAFTVSGGVFGAGLDNSSSLNSSINEINCLTSSSTSGCVGTQVWNTLDLAGQTSLCVGNAASGTGTTNPCAYGGGQGTIFVFKDISIGDPSVSHNTSFNETFLVPEPMTLSLMGAGLLGLGFLRRYRRK